jgi:hypothetical protein
VLNSSPRSVACSEMDLCGSDLLTADVTHTHTHTNKGNEEQQQSQN